MISDLCMNKHGSLSTFSNDELTANFHKFENRKFVFVGININIVKMFHLSFSTSFLSLWLVSFSIDLGFPFSN